ncbi:hypothetical protein B0H11DRAFT_1715856, partial [Mycena galericulata]
SIQTIVKWPLHKDDTLFRRGRPMGLNIKLKLWLRSSRNFLSWFRGVKKQ